MHVRALHVENVKLLRDFQLSFLRGKEPRMWTVLIGENGLCKTTVLQAIALAASGPDRASQLADVRSLLDVRRRLLPDWMLKKEGTASISAEFEFTIGMHEKRMYRHGTSPASTARARARRAHVPHARSPGDGRGRRRGGRDEHPPNHSWRLRREQGRVPRASGVIERGAGA